MFVIIPHKKKKGLCVACRCTNKHTPRDRFCAKHRHRYNKDKNPIKYTYQLLKSNAKRRKKEFTLTLEEFTKWCEETNYIEEKGRLGSSATIDRIDHTKGYSYDNLQKLSKSENSVKRWTDLEDDCPF